MTGDSPSLCGSQSCTDGQQLRKHPIVTTWVFDDLCCRGSATHPTAMLALTGLSRDLWNTTVVLGLDSVLDIKA